MESMNEVMELSTQDLDTVAGGCHKEYYCYEKREKKHHKYDCRPKYKKGCGDYEDKYEGGYGDNYGCGGYEKY